MSSSWPWARAAQAISSAAWVETAAARPKPKSSPAGLLASKTPSVSKVSRSPGQGELCGEYLAGASRVVDEGADGADQQ